MLPDIQLIVTHISDSIAIVRQLRVVTEQIDTSSPGYFRIPIIAYLCVFIADFLAKIKRICIPKSAQTLNESI